MADNNGFWIGWLDLLEPFFPVTLNHKRYSAIADLHTLQFTVTHALGFSVYTSRILVTELKVSPWLNRLIPLQVFTGWLVILQLVTSRDCFRFTFPILILGLCCTPCTLLYSYSRALNSTTEITSNYFSPFVIYNQIGPHVKHMSRVWMRVHWSVTQHWVWGRPHRKHLSYFCLRIFRPLLRNCSCCYASVSGEEGDTYCVGSLKKR
jgi:hypothetical protein